MNIAEILLKVALKHQKSKSINLRRERNNTFMIIDVKGFKLSFQHLVSQTPKIKLIINNQIKCKAKDKTLHC